MEEKVKKAIEEIRPHLKADGGDVELVEVTKEGVVKVRAFRGLRRLSYEGNDFDPRNY